MNLSEGEYDELQDKIIYSTYVIHVCTLVIGLVGNVTACIVILCSRSFHSITGFYLFSLTLADLLTLCTGVSFYVFSYKFVFLSQGKAARYIAEWACQASVIISTWTVMAFTVERYLAICHPFFIQSAPKKSRVKQIIIIIWSISFLLATLPTAQVVIENLNDEELKEENEKLMVYVADLWAGLCFFIPITVIIITYVLIWINLKRHTNGKYISCKTNNRADTKMLLTFVVIIMVFLLSWGPYYIYRVLYTHMVASKYRHIEFDEDFAILVDNFYLVNLSKQAAFPISAALNPIIYLMMSKNFRKASKTKESIISRLSSFTGSSVTSNSFERNGEIFNREREGIMLGK